MQDISFKDGNTHVINFDVTQFHCEAMRPAEMSILAASLARGVTRAAFLKPPTMSCLERSGPICAQHSLHFGSIDLNFPWVLASPFCFIGNRNHPLEFARRRPSERPSSHPPHLSLNDHHVVLLIHPHYLRYHGHCGRVVTLTL